MNGDANLDIAAGGFSGTVAVLAGAGTGTFGAPVTYSSIAFGDTMACGDLNNDGVQDLAFESLLGTTSVSVTLGTGGGAFGAPAGYMTGGLFASGITLTDLTGDGIRDIAAVFSVPNEVALLPGNGSGGFGAVQSQIVGMGPNGIVTSDFNLDGLRDMAVGVAGPRGISVLLSLGSGAFDAPGRAAAADGPSAVATADFNDDGKADLAIANSTSGNISILSGNGAGGFGAPTNVAAGAQPSGIAAGLLNADGNQDLVVSNAGANNISVYLGTGTGSFGVATNFATGTAPLAIELVDLNNNGTLDAVAANSGSGSLSVLLGTGAGTFGAATNTAVGTTPRAIGKGDANADGKQDLCVANGGSANISIMIGNGSGGFSSVTTVAAGTAPAGAGFADVNNDGKLDLLVVHETSGDLYVYIGTGTGSFGAPATYALGGSPVGVAGRDMDGDGKMDVLVANRDLSEAFLYRGDNSGSFGSPWRYATAGRPTGIATGDWNGDGRLDFVMSCNNTDNASIHLNLVVPPSILSHPSGQTVCSGSNVAFTVSATNVLSYQWRKNGVNMVDGGNVSGATTATLSLNPATTGDAASYDVVLSNNNGSTTSNAAVLTVVSSVSISAHPQSQSTCAGSTVVLSVTAANAATYQWRKNGVDISGATSSSLSFNPVGTSDAATYDVVCGNTCGSVTSSPAVITVFPAAPSISLHPVSQDVCAGGAVTFTVVASNAGSYQWRKNTINISGATTSSYTDSNVTAGDAGNYDCVVTNACGSVTSNGAVLGVFTGAPSITLNPVSQSICAGSGVTFAITATGAQSYQWRKNGINIGGATATSYNIPSVATGDAGSYDCVATNACGSTSSGAATLTVSNGVPSITTQPQSTLQCEGGPVTLSVVASGAQSYQWRKGGVNVSGATSSTLVFAAVVPSDAGTYDVIVTNACGDTTSAAAALTITNTLYVNAAATGANTGLSWTDAFTDLQSALATSCTNVEIWVAAGTYRPDQGTGNRSMTFQLGNARALLGGFVGGETLSSQRDPAIHVTTLDGDIGLSGDASDNSFHVVTGSGTGPSAVLDGFTVANGKADASVGGGVLVVAGSPAIRNCTITGNAAADGAGLYLDGGSAVVDRCTIQSNGAAGLGGGIRVASGTAIIKNSRLLQNSAAEGGGAAVSGPAVLANCDFRGNQATSNGGALRISGDAGALCSNIAMSGNTAASGAGMYVSANATLCNATIVNNTASGAGGGVRVLAALALSNAILWNNNDAGGSTQASQVSLSGGTVALNYCDIKGLTGSLGGVGNLGVDPKLVDPLGADGLAGTADDDTRLCAFSPCVDAGSNALVTTDAADLDADLDTAEKSPVDPAQQPRFYNDPLVADSGSGSAPIVDIGADEYHDDDPLPFGTGTFGCLGMQTMGTYGLPTINNSGFYLTCDRAPQFSFGLGLVTDSPDVPGTDLFGIGAIFHTDVFFATELLTFDFVSDGTGFGYAPAPIPNSPPLVGKIFYADTLWVWSTCSLVPPFNPSTSRGLKIKILP